MALREIKTVGVVGLGAIGRPIAGHIARIVHTVIGFDIRKEALTVAAPQIVPASSCVDLAARCDLILITVDTDEQVQSVLFATDGLVSGAREDAIIIVSSTIAPRRMTDIAARMKDKRLALLDAPLAGGEDGARTGRLVAFVGGAAETLTAARPVLRAFTSSIHHLGPLGAGLAGKLANNLIFWACLSANDEALKFGERLGVEPTALRNAITAANGQNWALSNSAADKPLPSAEKDMAIVIEEAARLGLGLPLSATVKDTITAIKAARSARERF